MHPISKDGNCGPTSDLNATCLNSRFGNCCSEKGFCGSGNSYCGDGCNSLFGKCIELDKQSISTSGSCGETKSSNVTCKGSSFGDCCSSLGYCGGNSTYCGDGCQSGFGKCDLSSSSNQTSNSTTSSPSTSTLESTSTAASVSLDGNCGPSSICLGSAFGDCCSGHGFCGGNSSYCDTGCRPDYGTCSFSTSTPSTASGGSSSYKNLGSGSIAGITVGSVVGGCFILGLIYFLLSRMRRASRQTPETGPAVAESKMPSEMEQAHSVSEADDSATRSEMDGNMKMAPVELCAPDKRLSG